MPESSEFLSLDSGQMRFLWVQHGADLAPHQVVGLVFRVEDAEKFPSASGCESLGPFLGGLHTIRLFRVVAIISKCACRTLHQEERVSVLFVQRARVLLSKARSKHGRKERCVKCLRSIFGSRDSLSVRAPDS